MALLAFGWWLMSRTTANAKARKFTKEDAVDVLEAADYDDMPKFTSKILIKVGATWQSTETYDGPYAGVVCKVTKNLLGPSFSITAGAGVFRVRTGPKAKSAMEQVDAHFFSADAGFSYSTFHVEGNAGLTLADIHASAFDLHLGVGVSTGIGYKDDSLTVKVCGTGYQFGRKIGISVLDNSFGVDLGKCVVM